MAVRTRDAKVVTQLKERMAIDFYPPPDDLSEIEKAQWIAALKELPASYFRERNLLALRIYVRCAAAIVETDPVTDRKLYFRLVLQFTNLAKNLSISVPQEVNRQNLIERRRITEKREEIAKQEREFRAAQNEPQPGESERPRTRQSLFSSGGRA